MQEMVIFVDASAQRFSTKNMPPPTLWAFLAGIQGQNDDFTSASSLGSPACYRLAVPWGGAVDIRPCA